MPHGLGKGRSEYGTATPVAGGAQFRPWTAGGRENLDDVRITLAAEEVSGAAKAIEYPSANG